MRRLLAVIIAISLLAASAANRPTIFATDATAIATVSADRLFVAVQVEARGDTSAETIPVEQDLAIVQRRLEHARVPARAIVESVLREVPQQFRSLGNMIDARPYGVVLLRFDRPRPELLDTLINQTLLAAFDQPLRDGIVAGATGSWYALDDCARVQLQARREAVKLARSVAEKVARAVGQSIDSNATPVLRELASSGTSEDSPYLCGTSSLPDVPPPQIRTLRQTNDFPGRFVAQSSVVAEWPGESSQQTVYATLPATITSDHAPPATDQTALEAGMIRSSVAVANAETSSSSAMNVTAIALSLARRRAEWLGADVDLVPSALLRVFDPSLHDDPTSVSYPERFNVRPTTPLIATFSVTAQPAKPETTLVASGTAEVRLPANQARITLSLPDSSPELRAKMVDSLARRGVEREYINEKGSIIEANVNAPTTVTMGRILHAIDDGVSASTPVRNERVLYATDDCDPGARQALAAAVANARDVAILKARERHLSLGPIVAADDVGSQPETFCGRGVLAVANPWLPSDPLAEPVVTSRANVTLTFAAKPSP